MLSEELDYISRRLRLFEGPEGITLELVEWVDPSTARADRAGPGELRVRTHRAEPTAREVSAEEAGPVLERYVAVATNA